MTTVLLTGANRGIGLELARLAAGRGWDVVGTARDPEAATELAATGARVEALDVTDDPSVAALATRLGGLPLDLLVANAGILVEDRLESFDPRDVLAQLDTNTVGPLRVVAALAENLRAAGTPKVAVLSSVMGSIAENTGGGYYGYRASKAGANAVVKSLSVDLAPIPVVALHPGYVRTRMTGGQGDVEPSEAAAGLLSVLDGVGEGDSGRFFDRHGEELPW